MKGVSLGRYLNSRLPVIPHPNPTPAWQSILELHDTASESKWNRSVTVIIQNNNFRIQVLKPSDKAQTEMIIASLVEIFLRLSDGGTATFCLPGSDNCFEPTATFAIDGATEKVSVVGVHRNFSKGEYCIFWPVFGCFTLQMVVEIFIFYICVLKRAFLHKKR